MAQKFWATLKEIFENAPPFRVKRGRLDTNDLYQDDHFTIAPVVFPIVSMDSTGKPYPLHNTAGVFPVTEASAVSILTSTNFNMINTGVGLTDYITHPGYNAFNNNNAKRIGRARVTADGAGAFAFESLVAALAGYYGVVEMLAIKADGIVAAGVLVYESPAATPGLPAGETLPTLATNVWQEMRAIVTHATLVDNQAVGVRGTGWGAGRVIDLLWKYWDET